MSRSDNYGLPESFGKSLLYKDDFPQGDQSERLIPLLCINGTGNLTSLPPPPPIVLPNPQVQRLEKVQGHSSPFGKQTQRWIVCVHSRLGDGVTY